MSKSVEARSTRSSQPVPESLPHPDKAPSSSKLLHRGGHDHLKLRPLRFQPGVRMVEHIPVPDHPRSERRSRDGMHIHIHHHSHRVFDEEPPTGARGRIDDPVAATPLDFLSFRRGNPRLKPWLKPGAKISGRYAARSRAIPSRPQAMIAPGLAAPWREISALAATPG